MKLDFLIFLILIILSSPIWAEDNCELTDDNINNLKSIVESTRKGPDLKTELKGHNQSGGRIVLSKNSEGKIKVSRVELPPLTLVEELEQREEVFQIFKKLNIINENDLNGQETVPNEKVMALLHQFAMSDAGAIWLRRVTDDTIAAVNRGYIELDASNKKLSEMITGKLTEDAQFDSFFSLFKVTSFSGKGANGGGGRIGIGDELFRDRFPAGGQKIDPLAIVSHEFGHTRYGDPTSGEHIHGEAFCVEHFENPVRVKNGFDERMTYCDPKTNTNINIKTKVITKQNCRN